MSSGWPGCARWWIASRDEKNSDDFLANLKIDLYPEEVYTFTPEGQDCRVAARRHAD